MKLQSRFQHVEESDILHVRGPSAVNHPIKTAQVCRQRPLCVPEIAFYFRFGGGVDGKGLIRAFCCLCVTVCCCY